MFTYKIDGVEIRPFSKALAYDPNSAEPLARRQRCKLTIRDWAQGHDRLEDFGVVIEEVIVDETERLFNEAKRNKFLTLHEWWDTHEPVNVTLADASIIKLRIQETPRNTNASSFAAIFSINQTLPDAAKQNIKLVNEEDHTVVVQWSEALSVFSQFVAAYEVISAQWDVFDTQIKAATTIAELDDIILPNEGV